MARARLLKARLILRRLSFAFLLLGTFGTLAAQAQPAAPERPLRADCPPGAGPNSPSIGRDSSRTLSDQLAESKGVICPPSGVDPDMQQKPRDGGTIKVIPPPGSPGGNPSVQPK